MDNTEATPAARSATRGHPEAQLVAEILRAIGARSDLRIWRNNTGTLKAGRQYVSFGLPGSADILGLLAPSGRLLAIECKSATGRQSDQQRAFQAMIEKFGGLYVLARTVAEVEAALP